MILLAERYRVAILDDEPVWTESIVSLLARAPEIEVVGTAATQNDAVTIAREKSPDLFLVDMNLGHAWKTGISATIEILDASPATDVIVLTATECDQQVIDAVSAGAIDYLQKSNCELLLPAILRHMRGEFSPGTVLAKSYASLRREHLAQSLSDQEYEILKHLSQNTSRSQITSSMNKSESTVKTQIRSLLHKLGVSNTSEAVSKMKHGGIYFPENNQEDIDAHKQQKTKKK